MYLQQTYSRTLFFSWASLSVLNSQSLENPLPLEHNYVGCSQTVHPHENIQRQFGFLVMVLSFSSHLELAFIDLLLEYVVVGSEVMRDLFIESGTGVNLYSIVPYSYHYLLVSYLCTLQCHAHKNDGTQIFFQERSSHFTPNTQSTLH